MLDLLSGWKRDVVSIGSLLELSRFLIDAIFEGGQARFV
jgi:hypothetical protein